MPIAILEIPRGEHINVPQAQELCAKAGDSLHHVLNVPDPKDKEIRVVEGISDKPILRISFTIGPDEYPDFEQKSFFPTDEQIESAGLTIQEMIKGSPFGISQIVINAWKDTTFVLREGETSQPISPISGEALKEIGDNLDKPRIKLVLSPEKREGVSFSKELGQVQEDESRRVTLELAKCITEILGHKEQVAAEFEFAQAADTGVSVEFDCEIKPDKSIPENVRRYMAESVLYILDSNHLTREGSGEVWIRQGNPDTKVFNDI